jgi:hypothetical protein
LRARECRGSFEGECSKCLFVKIPRPWCYSDCSLDWRHNGSLLCSLPLINFPRRRRHRKWTISDVASLRHHNLELTHISLSPPSSSSLVSLSARPAPNSSPSCCMRARLTGHEGKSRRSWPRTGSELRKVLAIFLSCPRSILTSSCCLLYPCCWN